MGSLQLYNGMGLCRNQGLYNPESSDIRRRRLCILTGHLTLGVPLRQHGFSNILLSDYLRRPIFSVPCRTTAFRCHSFAPGGKVVEPAIKAATTVLTKSQGLIQQCPLVSKLVPAVALLAFSLWGIVPLVRQGRNLLLNKKNENGWKKSGTYRVMTSYVQPLLLWLGALFICRALDLVVLPTEASKIVKDRLLNFVRSLSTVLAFAYCISSLIQQTQKLFSQTSDPNDARNMGFQFAGKAVYSAVWVAAVSLFMELLGFSTHKWLTAGGLGTVLITLAGREILTNFLSSIMIHATRPFVRNERIQIKIEGYEVSGTVEHVGWWSPTIIRGDHREAIHIPNHKFTVNVVRNITQKTHWRIKTHLAISYLDVNKINNIVADMRKVLAKNPQVEQQKLHRRIFLEDVHPENQALMILISCFVKTSHREEYLSVKEAILLDLLRVISHHRARLATPIRTIRKMHTAADMENAPFGESMYGPGGGASKRSLVVIEPSYKIYGEEKSKSQKRASKPSAEQEDKVSNPMSNETPSSDPTGTKPVSKPATTAKDTSEVSGGAEKPKTKRSGSKTKSPKRETDGSASAVSKSALEENLVLGVALEGSKRTLPIEEEIHSSPKEADAKELTGARRPGNRPLVADKEHKDGQSQTVVSSD